MTANIVNASALFSADERPAQAPAKKKSRLWLNIGIPVKTRNPETGEIEDDVLTFPVNLALDTMQKRKVPTQAPKTPAQKAYIDRIIASNALLERFQKFGFSQEPGKQIPIGGFVTYLQLLGEEMTEEEMLAASGDDNPYLAQMEALFAGAK